MENINKRNIVIKFSAEEKYQMESLLKKYDNLYLSERNNRIIVQFILNFVFLIGLILFGVNVYLQCVSPSTLSILSRWILNGSCIVILILVIMLYIIKENFIEVKCYEYAWYSNVVYGTIVREMEHIKKLSEKTNFVLKEDKLYYGYSKYDYVRLKGNIPNGDILVSVHPYENVHAWMAESM